MDFISGQKEPSFHKSYLCDDSLDRQTAIGFSLEERGWVALSLNDKVMGTNSIRRNFLELEPSLGTKTESPT